MTESNRKKHTVSLDKVRIGYGDHVLLDLKELSLEAGTINFITGPSGCGKSTLINVLLGLESPLSGEVKISGLDFFSNCTKEASRKYKRDSLGVVFQQAALFDEEKVRENILFSISGDRKKKVACLGEIKKILSRPELNLEHILEKYPSELSGGLMRLTSFLRAYVKKPKLLILDEPFVGLDANLTGLLKELIVDLCRKNECCVIIISHQYSIMKDIGGRILYCDKLAKNIVEVEVEEIQERLYNLKQLEKTESIHSKRFNLAPFYAVREFFEELGEFVLAIFYFPRSVCLRKMLSRFCSLFIESFMLIGLGLFLIGFSIAFQSGIPLGMFNLIDKLPAIFGKSVFTEVGPLLLGLLLGSRVVAGLTSEIGSKKLNRTLDYLQVSGIDPIDYIFSPIYLASLPGALVILVFSQLMALWGGVLAYTLVFNQSINAFLINSLNALSPIQWTLVVMKLYLFLVVMFMESYRWGNKTSLGAEELGKNVKHAIVHSAIGIIFVDLFFLGLIN